MATTEKDTEAIKGAGYSSTGTPQPAAASGKNYFAVDVALRILLFAATLVALVVMVTAKQTKNVPVPGLPVTIRRPAKFNHSPAFIYFIAALSVACLYSIITTLASFLVLLKPQHATKFLIYFAIWDVLILGIVSAATGAAGGVAYIGLKGNSHTGWTKICNVYDTFCKHIGSSIAVSLFASVLLVLLVMLSVISLHSKIRT